MFGLTQLGTVHTAISVIAVVAGFTALVRDREITGRNLVGKVYIVTTAFTCLTAFGIFEHDGGFNKAHVLGIVTLVVLGIAILAERTQLFGWMSRYVATVSYSATFLFNMIPAVVETTTRLPPSAPLVVDQDAPSLQIATGVLCVVFLIGATLQVLRLRAQIRQTPAA